MIMGSVCLRRERAAPSSLSSISSSTTWAAKPHGGLDDLSGSRLGGLLARAVPRPYLLVEVYQGLVWQLEGLDGLQDGVPVAAVDVCHEALDAVHGVQGHGGLLLQGDQGPVQVVLL